MGIESVSYRFEPSECEVVELNEWLQSRGATNGERERAYVLSGASYWIDLLVHANSSRVAAVQFRVAVTNPTAVVSVLHELISDLIVRFGGRLTDAAGKRVLNEENRFDVLMSEFTTGRESFILHYGEVTLPVSADQVFSQLGAESEDGG